MVLSLSPIGRSCEADLLDVITNDDPRTAIRILSVDYIFLRWDLMVWTTEHHKGHLWELRRVPVDLSHTTCAQVTRSWARYLAFVSSILQEAHQHMYVACLVANLARIGTTEYSFRSQVTIYTAERLLCVFILERTPASFVQPHFNFKDHYCT